MQKPLPAARPYTTSSGAGDAPGPAHCTCSRFRGRACYISTRLPRDACAYSDSGGSRVDLHLLNARAVEAALCAACPRRCALLLRAPACQVARARAVVRRCRMTRDTSLASESPPRTACSPWKRPPQPWAPSTAGSPSACRRTRRCTRRTATGILRAWTRGWPGTPALPRGDTVAGCGSRTWPPAPSSCPRRTGRTSAGTPSS